MCTVLENGDRPGPGRYALTETADGHVWGVCDEIDGLFGEPERGTYELFGWVPEGDEVRGCRRPRPDRPAGHAYEIDGRHITDEPGLHLALGEAVNGPGGYFGGCLDALADCLRGTFGYTAPATLLWRDAGTAREHLSRVLTADGLPRDLFAEALGVLKGGGMRVILA